MERPIDSSSPEAPLSLHASRQQEKSCWSTITSKITFRYWGLMDERRVRGYSAMGYVVDQALPIASHAQRTVLRRSSSRGRVCYCVPYSDLHLYARPKPVENRNEPVDGEPA